MKRTFDRAWPDLKNSLESLPPDTGPEVPSRSVENMTNEVLEIVRQLARSTPMEIRLDTLTENVSFIKTAVTSLIAKSQIERELADESNLGRTQRRGSTDKK